MGRLTRRSLLLAGSAVATRPAWAAPRPTPAPEVPRSGNVDVIIVGAGAAGIAAARRLAAAGRRFVLLEATSEIGGRCITDTKTFGVPFDRGAHWIYLADNSPVARLAPQTGLDLYLVPAGQRMRIGRRYAREGEMEDFLATLVRANTAIRDAARKGDVACAQVLPKDLGDWRPTIDFVLGAYGCGKDLSDVSTVDLARATERENGAFCRQGLGTLLAKLAPAGATQTATPVTRIELGRAAAVEVETPKGQFRAPAAIVTVSTDVLVSGKIKFDLPKRHLDAANKLKLGSHDHVAIELAGNPLGLRADELVFEKSQDRQTAAIFANVYGSTVCMIDVAGNFGRDLVRQRAGGDDRFRHRLAGRAIRHGHQEQRQAPARDALEPRALGTGCGLRCQPRGPIGAKGDDGTRSRANLLRRRGRTRDHVGDARRGVGIG